MYTFACTLDPCDNFYLGLRVCYIICSRYVKIASCILEIENFLALDNNPIISSKMVVVQWILDLSLITWMHFPNQISNLQLFKYVFYCDFSIILLHEWIICRCHSVNICWCKWTKIFPASNQLGYYVLCQEKGLGFWNGISLLSKIYTWTTFKNGGGCVFFALQYNYGYLGGQQFLFINLLKMIYVFLVCEFSTYKCIQFE